MYILKTTTAPCKGEKVAILWGYDNTLVWIPKNPSEEELKSFRKAFRQYWKVHGAKFIAEFVKLHEIIYGSTAWQEEVQKRLKLRNRRAKKKVK